MDYEELKRKYETDSEKKISRRPTKLIVAILLTIVACTTVLVYYYKINITHSKSEEETIIRDFLNRNLKDEFTPSKLIIEQRMLPEGKVGSENLYGYNWENDDAKFYVSTEYNEKDENILNNIVEVFLDFDTTEKLDPESSLSLVKIYFKEFGTLRCKFINKTKTTYCESYLPKGEDKIFVGAWKSETRLTTFVCEIPIESEIYDWNSCGKPFKEEGV